MELKDKIVFWQRKATPTYAKKYLTITKELLQWFLNQIHQKRNRSASRAIYSVRTRAGRFMIGVILIF